jgi:hypothetical protein
VDAVKEEIPVKTEVFKKTGGLSGFKIGLI